MAWAEAEGGRTAGGEAVVKRVPELVPLDVVAIPRAGRPAQVRDNCRAVDLKLSGSDLGDPDRAFPPPAEPPPPGMLKASPPIRHARRISAD